MRSHKIKSYKDLFRNFYKYPYYYLIIWLLSIHVISYNQIIADHLAVAAFEQIPENYINEVKKMWLVYAGESHSRAIRNGLNAIEEFYPKYNVSVIEDGVPEPYTEMNLRASRATWGDLDNSEGWIYSYGEEDWCCYTNYPIYTYNPEAIARTKAGITYCNSNDLTISVFAFGWCYDDGYELVHSYLKATEEYINYCSDSINTTVIYTTGPIDGYIGIGEAGYINSLRWSTIRDTVKRNESRILFDYADILSYNLAGEQAITEWDGHIYPTIHPENELGSPAGGHIGGNGAIKLGKAMWWLLARIAGWDGTVGGEDSTPPSAPSDISIISVSETSVEFSWTSSSDNTGVTGYNVYRDGSLLEITTSTSYNDNTVSSCTEYTYTVTALDAAGNESTPSAGLIVNTCAPDLAPTLIVTPNISHGVSNFNVIVRVTELNQAQTNGDIVVQIPTDSRWTLDDSFDQSLTSIDGMPLNNSDWSYSLDATYHVFTTSTSIASGGSTTFGFTITFNPDTNRGLYTITTQLVAGAGGETRNSNNTDSERLDYFQ